MEMNDNTYIGEDNTQVDFTQIDGAVLPDATQADVDAIPDATEIDIDVLPDASEITDSTEIEEVESYPEVASSDCTEVDGTQIDVDWGTELSISDNTIADKTKLDKTVLNFDEVSFKNLKKTNFGHIKKPNNNLIFAPRTTPLQDVRDYILSTIPLERFKSLKHAETPNFSSSYYKVILAGVIAWVLCVVGTIIL